MENAVKDINKIIMEINQQFKKMKKRGTLDEIRFGENLKEIAKKIESSSYLDNSLLIALEKFYQRCSLLIGLGALELDDSTKLAWKQYDQYHYAVVKTNLKVYGPTIVI